MIDDLWFFLTGTAVGILIASFVKDRMGAEEDASPDQEDES